MDRVSKVINAATALALQFKIANLVAEKAKELNIRDEVYVETYFQPAMDKLMDSIPKTQLEKLESFKKAIGSKMWKDIKDNPALPAMVEEHMTGLLGERKKEFAKTMKELIGLDDDDVELMLRLKAEEKAG